MRKGVAFLAVIAIIALVAIVGGGGYVAARNFAKDEAPRDLDFVGQSEKSKIKPTPQPPPSPPATPSPTPTPSPSPSGPTNYTDPLGRYSLVLPAGWVVNSNSKGKTYATIKFTGDNGNISITTGSGKDPAGGCSETTKVALADRIIDGCFLLQKDGSQILTRAYTKDTSGVDITVEAYFNPPASANRPGVLDIIKTIDIN